MKRLLALVAAVVAAACVLVGVSFALPPQDALDENLEYGYTCSGVKSESRAFTLAAAHDNSYFLFGSSELATRPDIISTAPDNVFQAYDCGMQFMYVGEAYDQSLWMAIAAGAYAPDMPNKKVGIIVSSQWFFDGGLEPGIFKMRFSYPLYRAFCANDAISPETKSYVAQRLADEGVDGALIDAGSERLPQDVIDAAAFDVMNDLRLRNALREVRTWGTPAGAPSGGAPDFEALRAQALDEAAVLCANNDLAVEGEYYTTYLEPNFEAQAGSMAGETLSNTPEYDDLQCFLDVCRACGLEPCVIIMPVNGAWYDHVGLDREMRAACYERVRMMSAEAGVRCLDLSPYEYEPYYLRDIMHLGWLGWLDVEQDFMEFTAEDREGQADSEGQDNSENQEAREGDESQEGRS